MKDKRLVIRRVSSGKRYARLHKPSDKRNTTTQTREGRHNQNAAALPRHSKGLRELRTIVVFAGLNFGERRIELKISCRAKLSDASFLIGQSKPGLTLTSGTDTVVGDC